MEASHGRYQALKGLDNDRAEVRMIAFNNGRGLVKIIKRGDQDLVFQTLGNARRAAYRAWQLARWLPFGAHHGVVMAAVEGPFEFQDFVPTTKGPGDPPGSTRCAVANNS